MMLMTLIAGAAVTLAAPEPEQRELRAIAVPFAMLPDSEELTYSMTSLADEDRSAQFIISTSVRDDAVVMQDTWVVGGHAHSVFFECEQNAFMGPVSGHIAIDRNDDTVELNLERSGDSMTLELQGQARQIDFPKRTLTQAALFRLLSVLPPEQGVTYLFDSYAEALDLNVRQAEDNQRFGLTCVGRSVIEINGQEVDCSQFSLDVGKQWHYFVDDSGRVVKATNGITSFELQGDSAHASVPTSNDD